MFVKTGLWEVCNIAARTTPQGGRGSVGPGPCDDSAVWDHTVSLLSWEKGPWAPCSISIYIHRNRIKKNIFQNTITYFIFKINRNVNINLNIQMFLKLKNSNINIKLNIKINLNINIFEFTDTFTSSCGSHVVHVAQILLTCGL